MLQQDLKRGLKQHFKKRVGQNSSTKTWDYFHIKKFYNQLLFSSKKNKMVLQVNAMKHSSVSQWIINGVLVFVMNQLIFLYTDILDWTYFFTSLHHNEDFISFNSNNFGDFYKRNYLETAASNKIWICIFKKRTKKPSKFFFCPCSTCQSGYFLPNFANKMEMALNTLFTLAWSRT